MKIELIWVFNFSVLVELDKEPIPFRRAKINPMALLSPNLILGAQVAIAEGIWGAM